MKSEWSLKKELCKIANSESINRALYKIGISDDADSKLEIVHSKEWIRSGAETYIYKFTVAFPNQIKKDIILKACVAFSPGKTLESILDQWIKRRSLLSKSGVSTPILYTYGNGIIVEEFINYKLTKILIEKSESQRSILIQLAQLAGTLKKLNFAPINPFDDLMSRGNDVVVVDFGQDLGPSNCKTDSSDLLYKSLIKYLENKAKSQLTKHLHDELYEIYSAEKNNCFMKSIN